MGFSVITFRFIYFQFSMDYTIFLLFGCFSLLFVFCFLFYCVCRDGAFVEFALSQCSQ